MVSAWGNMVFREVNRNRWYNYNQFPAEMLLHQRAISLDIKPDAEAKAEGADGCP